MSGSYYLASVDRVMKTLDAFTADSPELRLTDLSERLRLPKSQVLRIVSTLEAGGYLDRDPETKRYRLGIRVFQLGMLVREQLDLRRIARPVIRSLADQTLETVGLIVTDPTGPICVDVIESPKGLRVFAHVGRHMPWNAGTSGKVVLAFLAEEQRERILATVKLRRYTKQTITDPAQLRTVLNQIRADGYHVAAQDLDEDAIGVAAPLFDHDGRLVGAISLAAPISRVSEDELEGLICAVQYAAAEISRLLGYGTVRGNHAAAADD
jgi:IclR family KDG regulon transcriptional repressor